jgi:asparagine synthase (glutamine-hydrolysing)
VHGFTIANTDARYEEQEIVEKSVAELGIRHTNVSLDAGDFLSKLRTLVRYHDAPGYTITSFTSWMLMEAIAAHGYRIAVSGTSADELFTGYYDHHLQYLAEVRGNASLFAAASDGWRRNVRPWVRNPYLSDPDQFVKNPDFRGHIFLNSDCFAERLCRPWSEPFTESRYTNGLLRNRMLNELFHEATPVILHEDDLNAMYFSIENRSPFLDRALFEFCHSIPTEHLIRDGFAKVVLRDAMRGIVPDCVLDSSRKVGFNAPIHSLLDMHDSATRAAMLDDSPIFEHVRRDAIEHLMSTPAMANSESKFLFNFLSAKLFLEECASLQKSSAGNARITQSMPRPVEEAA